MTQLTVEYFEHPLPALEIVRVNELKDSKQQKEEGRFLIERAGKVTRRRVKALPRNVSPLRPGDAETDITPSSMQGQGTISAEVQTLQGDRVSATLRIRQSHEHGVTTVLLEPGNRYPIYIPGKYLVPPQFPPEDDFLIGVAKVVRSRRK